MLRRYGDGTRARRIYDRIMGTTPRHRSREQHPALGDRGVALRKIPSHTHGGRFGSGGGRIVSALLAPRDSVTVRRRSHPDWIFG